MTPPTQLLYANKLKRLELQAIEHMPGEPETLSSNPSLTKNNSKYIHIFLILLFICAYKAWVISLPCPHPKIYFYKQVA
jgi:hypothetical protein